MRFAQPEWLYGLAAGPVAAILLTLASGRARTILLRLDPRSLRARSWTRLLLVPAALCALALALAGPRWGYWETAAPSSDAAVVIVVDTSGSMLARDVSPDRFTRARVFLKALLRLIPSSDPVGLVRVEGAGEVVAPLTLDRAAVENLADELAPRGAETSGSDLGDGLTKAAALLSARSTRARTVIFISDGEDLEGTLPEKVADCVARGIVLDTVCAGARDGGPVPARGGGWLADEQGHAVVSRARPDDLRAYAERSGGTFVDLAEPGPAAARLAARLRTSKATGRGPVSREPADRSSWPLAVAVTVWAFSLAPLGGKGA